MRVGREEAPVASEQEKNKALVRRFFEAADKGDLDTLGELLAPDFVDHSLLPDQESFEEGPDHPSTRLRTMAMRTTLWAECTIMLIHTLSNRRVG